MLRNVLRRLRILSLGLSLLAAPIFASLLAPAFVLASGSPPAETPVIVPGPGWQWDTDHLAPQLPQWETPEERDAYGGVPPQQNLRDDPPPLAPVRNCAEYEPMIKALIRYPLGIPYSLIREMAEHVQISCVVSQSSYNTARNAFQSNGVDPDAVDWILANSDSYWTRDYGPWFVYDGNGEIAIIDHYYNRPYRPNDNLIPIVCGDHWGLPVHTHSLWNTGGNYMTDGYGFSFQTTLVWDENGGMTHQQIFDLMHDYYGLVSYNVVPDVSAGGIHHIDCWAKMLDEETIVVKQVAQSHADYQRCEQDATLLASLQSSTGRNYRVVRVYCASIGGSDVASYTNSLILNDKVLVPTFNLNPHDANALQVYRDAMPGYEVIGFTGSWLSDDAIHCRVMGIPDFQMLRVGHTPIVSWDRYAAIPVRAFIDDRSEAGLLSDSLLVYWRAYPDGTPPPAFTASALSPDQPADWYRYEIPPQPNGTRVDYYIHAVDLTGRREGMPRTEPAASYSFLVTTPSSDVAESGQGLGTRLQQNRPNPFRSATTFSFELKYEDDVQLSVYDAQGRLVRRLIDGRVGAGHHEIVWDGTSEAGRNVPAGTYFYSLQAGDVVYRRAAVLAK
ncbi:MAG: agmatine deiminase family protein [Candidatus Eisenbacteria bacterium]